MDGAAIHTIHGFCQRVLRDSAFDSGVAFETELVTDISALRDEIVHDFWAREVADAPEDFVRALARSQAARRAAAGAWSISVCATPRSACCPSVTPGAERWFEGQTAGARGRAVQAAADRLRAERARAPKS